MENVIANLSGKVKRVQRNGRSWLVAPATLLPEAGVLNGSDGPGYYPPEETSRDPLQWNGLPIVVYHPTLNGIPTSGREPEIDEIGRVYKTVANGKLSAELWFDEEATRRVDIRVANALDRGEPIELSTGLHVDKERTAGIHNGKPYDWIARNYRPDHLAILPDQKGACSVNDGCGVLVNEDVENSNPEGCNQYKDCEGGGGGSEVSNLPKGKKFVSDSPGSRGREYSVHKTGDNEVTVVHAGRIVGTVKEVKGVGFASTTSSGIGVGSKATTDQYVTLFEGHHTQGSGRYTFRQSGGRSKGLEALARSHSVRQTTNEDNFFNRFWTWLTNAGKYRNPQSSATGKYKPHGAGTGKGDVHEAAQRGAITLTAEDGARGADAKAQAEVGHNPPNWAVDETLWEKAKAAADKGDYDGDTYWAVVVSIYQKMGGTIEGKSTENVEVDNCGGEGSGIPGPCAKEGGNESESSGPTTVASVQKLTDSAMSAMTKIRETSLDRGKVKERKAMEAKLLSELKVQTTKLDKAAASTKDKAALKAIADTRARLGAFVRVFNQEDSQAAQGDTNMATREQNIQHLVVNCDCFKTKQKVLENKESFTDEDIQKLRDKAEKDFRTAATLNTLTKGFKLGANTLVLNAEGDIKVRNAKGKEMDPEDLADAGVDEEEEDAEGNKVVKVKKAVTKNEETVKPKTTQEWLDSAPLEIKDAVTNAMKITADERTRLMTRLTVNMDDATRTAFKSKYGRAPLDTLRDMVSLIPVVKNERQQEEPVFNFEGAAGGGGFGLTDNEQADVLDIESAREEYDPAVANRKKEKATA